MWDERYNYEVEKKIMNENSFLLRGMWLKYWSCVISSSPVNLCVHRTCRIGVRTFFICHEATYNHVIIELCDFVHSGPIPLAITLSSLVVMRHVKTEIYIFLFVTWLLCYVTTVSDNSFSKVITISSLVNIASRKFKYSVFLFVTWPQVITWKKDTWLLSMCLFIIRHYPCCFSGHTSRENGGITFFICHVTWCVHVISRLCGFVDNIFSS